MILFDSIFNALKSPMAIMVGGEGEELRFIHTNEAFTRLTGLSETELCRTSPLLLFTAWNGRQINDGLPQGCFLVKHFKHKTQVQLSCQMIEKAAPSTHLLIAEDVTASAWIDMMTSEKKVLLSGVISPDFIIDRFIHNSPDFLQYQLQGENASALEFIDEHDRERIMFVLERSVARNQTETVTLRTKMLVNVFQLDITLTFCPFFNGDGSLKHYGFVVTDLQPVTGEVDSSVQLKVLMARANKSAQQLASDTGISMQTISKLRNGKICKPQRLTAEHIAAELGVSPQEIWPNL